MESTITTTWQRVLEDPRLRDLPYKVETNEKGQVILSPHKPKHSLQQGRIVGLLYAHGDEAGETAVEFAIETRQGVKVPDVVWVSQALLANIPEDAQASPLVPEICVEVLSSANTDAEMAQKRRLYLAGGALEVWLCDGEGHITFYIAGQTEPVAHSLLMPDFPSSITP